ncbi:hypothetical protein NDU88_003355 [Pleurodeles waltl]|uniref:Uncharacterized protein n=1 Tax=Pleurodeles waltl TaxID=8319 RepID=A0AAV7PEE2_PLEWA|nr:hypothetical protein NDU88_003355 [Pleurodeles waltl]
MRPAQLALHGPMGTKQHPLHLLLVPSAPSLAHHGQRGLRLASGPFDGKVLHPNGDPGGFPSPPGTAGVGKAWKSNLRQLGSMGLRIRDEIQAIASMMEKQAQIVVKPKEISEEEKRRKAAVLAQYANITDEEEYPFSYNPAVNIIEDILLI